MYTCTVHVQNVAIPSSTYRVQTSSCCKTDGVRGLQRLCKGHELFNSRGCKRIMEVDFEGCRAFCGALQFPNLASTSLHIDIIHVIIIARISSRFVGAVQIGASLSEPRTPSI